MADTVDLSEITEYWDSAGALDTKVHRLASLLRKAKHAVVFTGAGISTAAKIPDFRGPSGVWTRQAQGREGPDGIELEQALPTFSHRAIKTMMDRGLFKYCVSQNIDGLHRRSGVPADSISELHGNSFKEVCWSCDAEYLRTFDTCTAARVHCRECRARVPHFCHCTDRRCTAAGCGAKLKDSIIHFGEDLPGQALRRAYHETKKADLVVVVGSSLRVTPACDIPLESLRRGGKLVIINLQKTPIDHRCTTNGRVFAKIDDVFQRLAPLLLIDDVAPADPRAHRGAGAGASTSGGAAAGGGSRSGRATLPLRSTGSRDAHVGMESEDATSHRGAARAAAAVASGEPATVRAPASIVSSFVVGNTHRRVDADDGNAHEWSLYVLPGADTPAAAFEAAVDHITIALHPTFTPSSVVLRQAPFVVKRVGWGTFEVGVEVTFKTATGLAPVAARHMLSFAPPHADTVEPVVATAVSVSADAEDGMPH